MTISLYDYSLSGSCYKVRLMLGFLGLEYDREQVNFYPGRQHKSPEFLAINPLGQLPVLRDGDLVLRDAQAILAYLAKKYDDGGTWLPDDPDSFGQVMMWVMFAADSLMAASAARLHDVMSYDLDIDEARRAAHRAFRILDDHLTHREIDGGTWIVGDHPTIADVACFPYVGLSGDGGIGLEDYPAIRNWLRAFRSLPRFHAMSGIPEYV